MQRHTQVSRILGIDPGSHKLGVGCVEIVGQTTRMIFADTLSAPASGSLYERLAIITAKLEPILDQLQPHSAAVESSFFGKNARSAFQLGVARGAAVSCCMRRGLPIFEYAPTQVKASVTGHGRADKTQIQKMLELILQTRLDLGFDATDALAIALCHAHTHRPMPPLQGVAR